MRIVVRLGKRTLVRQLVHTTRHETVAVDAAQSITEFGVQYHRVETVLDRLAKSGIGEFLAHIRCTKDHDNKKFLCLSGAHGKSVLHIQRANRLLSLTTSCPKNSPVPSFTCRRSSSSLPISSVQYLPPTSKGYFVNDSRPNE